MKEAIQTILLDLGGVVFGTSGTSDERIDWDTILSLNYIYGHRFNIGEAVFADFMAAYNRRTGQKLSGPVFLEAVFDTLVFNRELVDLIRVRYPIVIVSDNYRENIEYISRRFSFSDWSEQGIYSFDLKLEKSDPRFFQEVLQILGAPPQSLLLIDDSQAKIDSAAQSGIQGIQYENNHQVSRYLAQLETS